MSLRDLFASSNSSAPDAPSTTKASTSSASTSGTKTRNFRELRIDLGSNDSKKALKILLQMDKRKSKVRQARVFTSTGYICSGATGMVETLELLARLPNLKHVTIDFYERLPLQALCFLCNAPNLKILHLENVHLSLLSHGSSDCDNSDDCSIGSLVDIDDSEQNLWSNILSQSSQLQELTLVQCRGTSAIEQLIAKGLPKSLKALTLARLSLGRDEQAITDTLRALFCHASGIQLQSLKLLDLSGLLDHHVQTLAEELSQTVTAILQELEFTSSTVGSVAGRALTRAVARHQPQLQSFQMHVDWEQCGTDMAKFLVALPQLSKLDLKLYGDDHHVRADVLAIADALSGNSMSQLKRLRLSMELEAISVAEEDSLEIMTALEEMLQTNDRLKYLVLDDTLEEFPLPPTIQSKLRLNQSGAPKLVRRTNSNINTHDQFVQAVIYATKKQDLNTIFQILSMEPTLCCAAAMATPATKINHTSTTTAKTNSLSDWNHNRRTNTHDKARKFIKRQMKSIFAKSA